MAHGYSSVSTQRVLSDVTNATGFRWFSKILRPRALDESSLRIGRLKGLKVDGTRVPGRNKTQHKPKSSHIPRDSNPGLLPMHRDTV